MHGIDPEDDQHISRLLFRVGGERGEGTLLDKLGSVLSRMGIELEFDSSSILADPDPARVSKTPTSPSPKSQAADPLTKNPNNVVGERHTPLQTLPPLQHIDTIAGPRPGSPRLGVNHSPPRLHDTAEMQPDYSHLTQHLATGIGVKPAFVAPPDDFDVLSPSFLKEILPATQSSFKAISVSVQHGWFTSWIIHAGLLANEGKSRAEKALVLREHSMAEKFLIRWKSIACCDKTTPMVSFLESHNDRCERMAGRARQIYVLTTGFTLWHHFSASAAERTAVARRHILRMRHFDSWRQVAIAEYCANRALSYAKYLPRWVGELSISAMQEQRALESQVQTVLPSVFLTWKRLALDKAINFQRSWATKVSVFLAWQQTSKQTTEVSLQLDSKYRQTMVIRVFSDWASWSITPARQAFTRHPKYYQYAFSTAFSLWHAASSARPNVDTLARLFNQHQRERLFRIWDFETKSKNLEAQHDRRLLTEAFAVWALSQKIGSFQHQRQMQSKEFCFSLMLSIYREREETATRIQTRSSALQIHQAKAATLFQTWLSVSAEDTLGNTSVLFQYRDRILSTHLDQWLNLPGHNVEMERWAKRGLFYFTVHRNFSEWRLWARCEKERKLRQAYTAAKHHVNDSLVVGCWGIWQASHAFTATMHDVVTSRAFTRHLELITAWMESWVWTTRYFAGLHRHSLQILHEILLYGWRELAEAYAEEDIEARHAWGLRIYGSCWDRWDIALRWAEGQNYNAENMTRRRRKQTLATFLLGWKQFQPRDRARGADRRGIGLGPDQNRAALREGYWRHQQTPRLSFVRLKPSILDYTPSATQPHADSSDLDLESIESTDGTVMTPTRWNSISRHLNDLPSTTPSAPLPTPYERELRQRYNAGDVRMNTYRD